MNTVINFQTFLILYHISDYFKIASVIISVEFDSIRFNEGVRYCGSIYDYEKEYSDFD